MPLSLIQTDPTEMVDEDTLIAEVSRKVKHAEALLQAFHRQWFVNIAMRRGMQYIQAQTASKAIVMPPESEDRVRMIINRIQGIHQTRLAKLIKDVPKLETIPSSPQEESKDLARKGTQLLDWFWTNQHMPEKLVQLGSEMLDIGTGFLYVYWDHNAGPKIPIYQMHQGPVTGKEPYKVDTRGYILDKEGERIFDHVSIGDVVCKVVASFDVINDGISKNVDDSHWIILQQAMSLKEIRSQWPERGAKVKPEKDIGTRAYYQRRLMGLVGNQSEFFTPEIDSTEDLATVRTYMEKKSDKYPQGRYIVTANGILLEAGPMPFEHGLYPLIRFTDIEITGSFWGLGTVENLIPLQKGYNRVWSQIIENGNNHGNVKLLVTKDHGLHKEAYDDSGDEVMEYNPGTQIEQLQPASLPSHVVGQIEWYDRAFEDVSGQHEVSNARLPSGVKSGRAILALQEQDDTRLAPTKLLYLRNIERLGSMVLQLYAQFQEEARTYQIIGRTVSEINEITISKQEIQSMNKDVRVQSENLIAAQKQMQRESITELWDEGLFGDKNDPVVRKRVMQMLEFPNEADFFEEGDQDIAQAKHENDQFVTAEGLVPTPDPLTGKTLMSLPAYDFEDHDIHLRVINQLRKSPRYRQFNDLQRRAVDLHAEMHAQFRASAAGQGQAPTNPNVAEIEGHGKPAAQQTPTNQRPAPLPPGPAQTPPMAPPPGTPPVPPPQTATPPMPGAPPVAGQTG